jgi:Putative restriction endonuclease
MFNPDLEPLDGLPTAEDLPESDGLPVDSELQEFMSNFLKGLLIDAWADRNDWFFGVDMGFYYSAGVPPVVPDGFLVVGVDRIKSENLRLSYVLWEEQVLPQLVLEVVSKTYRGEYNVKKDLYEDLGILYYVVYNPLRKRKPSLEIYKLIQGKYVQMVGNPIWMPELGLGIGKERFNYQGYDREWVFWFDENNHRYLTAQERVQQSAERAIQSAKQATKSEQRVLKFKQEAQQAKQEAQQVRQEAQQAKHEAQQVRQEAQQAKQEAQRLADRLRALGFDPEAP